MYSATLGSFGAALPLIFRRSALFHIVTRRTAGDGVDEEGSEVELEESGKIVWLLGIQEMG